MITARKARGSDSFLASGAKVLGFACECAHKRVQKECIFYVVIGSLEDHTVIFVFRSEVSMRWTKLMCSINTT